MEVTSTTISLLTEHGSYSHALEFIKAGGFWTRSIWKPGKWIRLIPGDGDHMSYLAMEYANRKSAPWTPSRCDQMENDWVPVVPTYS